jgi:ABC-type uncharacterized transport system ATPase subunit
LPVRTQRRFHAKPGGAALNRLPCICASGEITGLAGISGNGQAALAALIAGTLAAVDRRNSYPWRKSRGWSPARRWRTGLGRIPEDRHATGMIGDMSVAENVISEAYRSPRFSRFGFLDWKAAASFAQSTSSRPMMSNARRRMPGCGSCPGATCRS